MDPVTVGLFVDEFIVDLFWGLIWLPLLDDNEGESSGDTILSCFVFDSLLLFRCLVVEEIMAGLG